MVFFKIWSYILNLFGCFVETKFLSGSYTGYVSFFREKKKENKKIRERKINTKIIKVIYSP